MFTTLNLYFFYYTIIMTYEYINYHKRDKVIIFYFVDRKVLISRIKSAINSCSALSLLNQQVISSLKIILWKSRLK